MCSLPDESVPKTEMTADITIVSIEYCCIQFFFFFLNFAANAISAAVNTIATFTTKCTRTDIFIINIVSQSCVCVCNWSKVKEEEGANL